MARSRGLSAVVPILLFGCGGGAPPPGPGSMMGRLSAGAGHTCAVERGGGVACWGSNPDGQLGDGSELDAPLPQRLDGVRGMRAVAAAS